MFWVNWVMGKKIESRLYINNTEAGLLGIMNTVMFIKRNAVR